MDTSNALVTTGTREELAAELWRLAEGWDHLGKPRMRERTLAGMVDICDGATSVQVGMTEYRVTEPTQSATIDGFRPA